MESQFIDIGMGRFLYQTYIFRTDIFSKDFFMKIFLQIPFKDVVRGGKNNFRMGENRIVRIFFLDRKSVV